jgi:hypothetical protein
MLSMPVESPDGRLVLWASDWESSLGEQIGAEKYERTDVFIVNVTSGATPPATAGLAKWTKQRHITLEGRWRAVVRCVSAEYASRKGCGLSRGNH